jgi:hypothetical protein
VILRIDGALHFVPASVAVSVAPAPQIARVPGAPGALLGVTLHDGDVVPVIAIGGAREAMLVCSYLGEKVGLMGASIEATGLYDVGPEVDTVQHRGETARSLDISAIYARVQGDGWAGRWRA